MADNSIVIMGGTPGRVVALVDPSTPSTASFKGPLDVEGWAGFSSFNSILTRCLVSSQCNYQFLHTFGGRIYAYSFGDRIGTIGLSGLAFQERVFKSSSGGSPQSDPTPGIAKVLQFYNENRLAKRQEAMTITFAGIALKGMLTNFNADVADPENRVFQFDMQLALIPDNTEDSLNEAKNKSTNESGQPIAPDGRPYASNREEFLSDDFAPPPPDSQTANDIFSELVMADPTQQQVRAGIDTSPAAIAARAEAQ